MKPCADYRERLAAEAGGDLPPGERSALEAHLARCAACRTTLEELRRTVAAIRSLPPLEPPADLPDRILARIARSAEAAGPSRVSRLLHHPLVQAASLLLIGATGYMAYRSLSRTAPVLAEPAPAAAPPGPWVQPPPASPAPPSPARPQRPAPARETERPRSLDAVEPDTESVAPAAPTPAPPALKTAAPVLQAAPGRTVDSEPPLVDRKAETPSARAKAQAEAPAAVLRIRLDATDPEAVADEVESAVHRAGGRIVAHTLPDTATGLRLAVPGNALPTLLDSLERLGRLRERPALLYATSAWVTLEIRW